MIVRALVFGVAAVVALALAACGEKSETTAALSKQRDAEPWTASDAANPSFYAPGWKVGDKAAWELQIRHRNQGQNEYAR